MAQSGLHGLIGGWLAHACVRPQDTPTGQERTKGLKFGFVLGALIPDVDFFVLGPMFLIDPAVALTLHRSFTHSLVTAAVLLAVMWLAATGERRDYRRGLALGLAGGILSHLAADVVIWFGGIQVLWPLGYAGVPQSLNLWAFYQPPRLVSNLLGAADYLAFGLYYLYLGATARRTGLDSDFLPRLRVFTVLQWVFFVIYGGLSFYLGSLFDIAHYAAFILVFFPVCLYVTAKMKRTVWVL